MIEQLDALYMTRIQKEHNDPHDAESMASIDFSRYCLTPELVARMKEYAPILHPFPRDQHFGEIPPEIDNDPRAMYFRQARNGMWIRAALLAHIFDVDHHISRHFLQRVSASCTTTTNVGVAVSGWVERQRAPRSVERSLPIDRSHPTCRL